MKEAVGGISIFQIVIVFILLFTGIMCLTINHSKAFGVKDEIITIIQNSELKNKNNFELDKNTIKEIIDKLEESGYRITGKCPDDDWVGYDRSGNTPTNNPAFCIRANNVSNTNNEVEELCKKEKCKIIKEDNIDMVYYDIILFYQLDIPGLNRLMNFEIRGSTKTMFA